MAILIDGAPGATSIKNENDFRIREIAFEISETGYYDKSVDVDGQIYYAYYMPISYDNEIIGMAFAGERQEDVTGAIQSTATIFVATAVVLIIVFAIVALLFSRGLSKSFTTVGKNVNALSKGILSKQKASTSRVKEMSVLLSETNLMQENLSETIGKVKDVAQGLVNSVSEVTDLSESSSSRAKQITTSMDELDRKSVV